MITGKTNIRHKGEIVAVSLGPGDPGLITVKGLKALENADRIYFPGSLFKDGRKDSYSLSILKHFHLDPGKLKGFYLQMSLERENIEKLYEATFEEIKTGYEAGQAIAIVSEGDTSTYSSFSYLLNHFQKAQLPVQLIPGITSYALAAACQQTPLCLQNEKLIILARVQSEEELQQCLVHYDTIVLMKIKSTLPLIFKALESEQVSIFYGERLGTDQEFTSKDPKEIKHRKVPYFALMIVRKKDDRKTRLKYHI